MPLNPIEMWGIDLSHTAHTGAQTGIQHVCRDLLKCFTESGQARPVIYDPYSRNWREPDSRENGFLFPDGNFLPSGKRSSKWSRWQKFRGRFQYLIGRKSPQPEMELLFCPELFDFRRDSSIFSPAWPSSLVRVAYFYDSIPLKFPDWTPQKTVERFPDYLVALSKFDHVTCISQASESDLHAGWDSLGIDHRPETSAITLGLPLDRMKTGGSSPAKTGDDLPVLLMVGTLEARKNHLALLEACESVWESGMKFELRLVGMLNKETGRQAAEKISELQESGRSIVWEGPVSNDRLSEVYLEADFFIYPSIYEGFGLPVLEALSHGLPTIATDKGALSELVHDGGCLACGDTSAAIANAIRDLLSKNDLQIRLREEARSRHIRNVKETASDLQSLFQELSERPRS